MTKVFIRMRSGEQFSWEFDTTPNEVEKGISRLLHNDSEWLVHDGAFLRISEVESIEILSGETA